MAISGQSTALFVNQYDLTTDFKDLSLGNSAKELETTAFQGDAATYDQTFQPGIQKGKFSASGFWSQGANAADVTSVDSRLSTIFGVASRILSVGWQGTTIGNKAVFFQGFHSQWGIGAKVADLVAVMIDLATGDGPVDWGVWVANKVARGTGTNVDLTSVDFGAASTTSSGFAAALHISAMTGTVPGLNAKLQDSADNITFTDVASGAFSAANSVGSEFISATTSIKRYVRVRYTFTGSASPSVTFVVAFAKR